MLIVALIVIGVIALSILGPYQVDIDSVIPESIIDVGGEFVPGTSPVDVEEIPAPLVDETPVTIETKPVSIFPRGSYVKPTLLSI